MPGDAGDFGELGVFGASGLIVQDLGIKKVSFFWVWGLGVCTVFGSSWINALRV